MVYFYNIIKKLVYIMLQFINLNIYLLIYLWLNIFILNNFTNLIKLKILLNLKKIYINNISKDIKNINLLKLNIIILKFIK